VFLLAVTGCPSPGEVRGVDKERVHALDELFDHEWGWTGADGAYSIALTSSQTLWLFADTILDRWGEHPKMVRNSIGLQSGKDMEFSWGPDGKDFFPPQTEGTWLWPGDAYLDDEELVVFLHEFVKTGEGAFGFKRTGCWLARVANPLDPPASWDMAWKKLPFFGEHLYFGIACVEEGETTYIYGALEEPSARYLIISRIQDDGTWEFLNEDGWGKAPTKPRRLCSGIGAELTVKQTERGFQLVTTDNGLSKRIWVATARHVWGEWEPLRVLFECPEPSWDSTYFCYGAKSHPELAQGPDEVVVTYCCNSTDFAKLFKDRRIYLPRFVIAVVWRW